MKTARDLALLRDAMGQGGIEEGLKLTKGLHVGDAGMPAGDGDLWLENSIRYSTAIGAGASAATQTLPGNTFTWQPMVYDTEIWDTDDIFDLAVSTSRMYITTPGVYSIHGYVMLNSGGAGMRGIAVVKNASTLHGGITLPGVSASIRFEANAVLLLEEGDFLHIGVYHDLAVSLVIQELSMAIVRVP